jgi:acyl-CoA reductase-like NAD-dependent aldehyde dehydrogenase
MVDVGTRHGKRVHAHGAWRQLHAVGERADPAEAARRVCASAIGLAGQGWLAGCTVVVTGAKIASTFVDELCAAAAAVRVGSSTDPATSMGPVVQRSRQRELLDRVRDAGSLVDVLVDGSRFADGDGYFFGPTVLDRVPVDHPLVAEQVPGPVISVVRDAAMTVEHRDAQGTVTTLHDGGSPAPPTGWFGSLPWSWDHALQLFTTA